MSSPLSQEALVSDVAAYISKECGGGVSEPDARATAELLSGYLTQRVRGIGGGLSMVLWLLFSAAYEGIVPQADLDFFFKEVGVDPAGYFQVWHDARQTGDEGEFTLALLPGRLADADIAHVTSALFAQQSSRSEG